MFAIKRSMSSSLTATGRHEHLVVRSERVIERLHIDGLVVDDEQARTRRGPTRRDGWGGHGNGRIDGICRAHLVTWCSTADRR